MVLATKPKIPIGANAMTKRTTLEMASDKSATIVRVVAEALRRAKPMINAQAKIPI